MQVTASGQAVNPSNSTIIATPTGGAQGVMTFTDAPADTPLSSTNTITPAGGSQPHENTQPFLCINFIISLFGIFPSQT
jgi:microcystin-dependent protein